MNILKSLFTLVVLVGVAAVGAVILAPKYPQAQAVVDTLHLAALQPVANETVVTAGQLQAQIPKLGEVLGVKTEDLQSANKASIPQKTLEYARYAYCQQVVKDYEGRMNINSTSSASPKPSASSKPSEKPKSDLKL